MISHHPLINFEKEMDNLKSLINLLDSIQKQALNEAGHSDISKQRDKGTCFEHLTKVFLQHDKTYHSLYPEVYTYAEWAEKQGLEKVDTGIDLVAINQNGETVAIQCKFYADDYKIQKKDLDSFMNASGKKPFAKRLFVDSTMGDWSKNAQQAIENQQIPVNRLTLFDMTEGSVNWSQYNNNKDTVIVSDIPKTLHPHQKEALNDVKEHFIDNDRGKLIMACGTGKTFTSLRIAEQQAGIGKRVLYLVPSLSLMQQTIKEWFNDMQCPIYGLSVCSDSTIGKTKNDLTDIALSDLVIPATTDAHKIANQVKLAPTDKMVVVFSTYQSIQVISDSQNIHGMGDFDIVICDEAHRTTGATLSGEDESHFVKVHDESFIQAKKRLYMTATPRVYGGAVKEKAKEEDAILASMDDTNIYGNTIYTLSFNDAVEKNLLSDYKVIVLALNEGSVDESIQRLITTEDWELTLEDTTKLLGCYKALCKQDLKIDEINDYHPMRRAVAFCQNIKKSKTITNNFPSIVDEHRQQVDKIDLTPLTIEMEHVDGTYNAQARKQKLQWLQEQTNDGICRILSNARCLSEGVDVPTLDAVLFLHPRKSMVDVVQAVGRVMRKAPNKEMGFVILPIGIPANKEPYQALNNNKKYKVVWDVLNALRSHDERMEGIINAGELGEDISDKIEIIAVSNVLPTKTTPTGVGIGSINSKLKDADDISLNKPTHMPNQFNIDFEDTVNRAIMAKLVKNCGSRDYWEDWAKDVADIAQKHIDRIHTLLQQGNIEINETFDSFLQQLQDDLNPKVSCEDAVEMLAQHIITKPVFDALFAGYPFTKHNIVSIAMDKVLSVLQNNSLDAEIESLDKFYKSVQRRVQGLKTITAKQQLITELYEKFFKNAFPKTTQQLGIVYTPTEAVDFIIHSVNDVLKTEFNTNLGESNVNILDPFTGTGTFITRLLQSGLITPEQMAYKYKHEIHCNEIVLLAYYIASINIEQVYLEHMAQHGHNLDIAPFEGICLTDTFQMQESGDMVTKVMPDNSKRRKKQKALDVQVIIGNPPYSKGQKSNNDNAQNVEYPELDGKIAETYVKHTTSTNKNRLYDSYIRAIKWGSERMGDCGVMGYITNGGFIDSNSMGGLRKCLKDEHTNLYVFNLRGNIRKNMNNKESGEGGNIFDVQVGVAITIFVKNPNAESQGNIYYHDIGNNLDKKTKLDIIKNFKSIQGITGQVGWQEITPDKYNDWVNQRDDSFYQHIPIGDKKNQR